MIVFCGVLLEQIEAVNDVIERGLPRRGAETRAVTDDVKAMVHEAVARLSVVIRDTYPMFTTNLQPEADWRQIHLVATWMLTMLKPYDSSITVFADHAYQVAAYSLAEYRQVAEGAFPVIAAAAKNAQGD